VHTFRASQFIAAPLDQVFRFFSDARNLEAITPPALSFEIRSAPEQVERGSTIAYALRLRGFPIRWKTLIVQWEPPFRFVDVQLRGPYRLWNHTHEFVERGGGVEVTDRIDYVLPYAPLGEIAWGMVRRDIKSIFRFRRTAVAQALEQGPAS
jgi:ligand-binding SRPBCC domain-containing protein